MNGDHDNESSQRMDRDPRPQTDLRRAHPLALALIDRLRAQEHARVLDFGRGSGRNTAALESAGLDVRSVADVDLQSFTAASEFDGAISTHALLHGTPQTVSRMLRTIADALKTGAPLYATFASAADARYGKGTRIDDDTFAPDDGDEQGVAHIYFTEHTLRAMLERNFGIDALQERSVDDIVGRWAHSNRPHGAVHWFVQARRLSLCHPEPVEG
jgi:hypothetical protein